MTSVIEHPLKQRLSFIQNYIKGCFTLPKANGKTLYVVPISGGLDSFCTAYVLLYLFPDTKFTYVHCDTGVEVKGTREAIEKFEQTTGRKVIRIAGKKDLFEYIEAHGNYLPSQRARFCTQATKTLPIKRFFEQLQLHVGEAATFYNFVGLRADEPSREGIVWKENNIASVFPLQQLGLVKSDINNSVEQAQGIPLYYMEKSRSGCAVCPFSRRSEVIATWERSPKLTERAANMEMLPQSLDDLYEKRPNRIAQVVGASRNYLAFYRPSWLNNPETDYEGKRGKVSNTFCKDTSDLFNTDKKLFAAVEYHYYPNRYGLADGPMVYFEKLITYSTSLGGIKKALKHFWLHRLQTKELHGLDDDSMGRERQIAIIEININDYDSLLPELPTDLSSYTWQSDRKPLKLIRKTVEVIEHILLRAGIEQGRKSQEPKLAKDSEKQFQALANEPVYGQILHSSPFEKPQLSDLVNDLDIKDAPIACEACSR